MPLIEDLGSVTPLTVVDRLVDCVLGPALPRSRREPLVRFLNEREDGVTRSSVTAVLLLMTTMPEYQLC